MGVPIEEFDEPASRLEPLLCSSCKDVVDEPNFVCEAEHLACTRCLNGVLKTRLRACPAAEAEVCTARWDPRKSGFVRRQLDVLKRRCQNRRHGCPYTGVRAGLEEHVGECGFVATRCECGSQMLKKDYALHRNRTCPEAPTLCERLEYGCTANFKRKEKAAHDAACQRYRCSFVTQGCQSYGTKATISKHERSYCNVLQARLQTLETASTNAKSELDDCRQTIRSLKEDNTKLQRELDEAREKVADANAQRDIMASASQQRQSSKRKRTRSITASPLKAKSAQCSHERKRPRAAASQTQTIDEEESGMSSSSDFEMDQEDERLLALQLVKEEDGGPNLYRQEIAQIKRQLVEKDVEIARLTQTLKKLETDAAANKKKLHQAEADNEALREELEDKDEGIKHLRARLELRSALDARVKAEDPDDLPLHADQGNDTTVQESLSPYVSEARSSVEEEEQQDEEEEQPEEEEEEEKEYSDDNDEEEDEEQADTASRVDDAQEDAAGAHDEDPSKELAETLSTDEPTPPPPPISSSEAPASTDTVKSYTTPAAKVSASEPRARIWRTSQQQPDRATQASKSNASETAMPLPPSPARHVKKEASSSLPKSTVGPFNISSSEESDEELPTVEELFRGASQRPFNSQRPSVLKG